MTLEVRSLRNSVVMRFDKGHLCDGRLLHLVADLEHDLGSIFGVSCGYIPNGNGCLEARRESTRADFTDQGFTSGIVNLSVVASRSLHSKDAHTLASLLLEFAFGRQKLVGSQKSLFGTATASRTSHGPSQSPLNGVGISVQVVSVQAETSFQTMDNAESQKMTASKTSQT